MKRSTKWLMGWAATVGFALMAGGCGTSYPRRDPLGQRFPTVHAKSLADESLKIPDDFAGTPTLLLIGYKQNTQFDIDRWMLGTRQVQMDVRVVELPTIGGWVPRLFSRNIDQGMRRGIPSQDWSAVATVYRDAAAVQKFIGSEDPLPARVVLLDADGRVVFFHDEGYSVDALEALGDALKKLER